MRVEIMPFIKAAWHDPGKCTIIVITLLPGWTWEEVYRHDRDVVLPMLATVQHPVAIVVDMSRVHWLQIERDFTSRVAQSVKPYWNAPVDFVVFVSAEKTQRVLMQRLHEKIGPPERGYHTARTVQAGIDLIESLR